MNRLRYLATVAALAIGVAQIPVAANANEGGGHGSGGSHFAGGHAFSGGHFGDGRAFAGGHFDPRFDRQFGRFRAAPYSASATFFLATISVTVSVTVTQATTLLGIARSTLTATTLPWAATIRIRIRIPVRRINGGLVTKPPHLDCDAAVARCSADSRARPMCPSIARHAGTSSVREASPSLLISARRATAPVGQMSLSGRRPIVLSTYAGRQVERLAG